MSLREDALDIFAAALKASDPAEAVRRHMPPVADFDTVSTNLVRRRREGQRRHGGDS